MYHIAAFIQKPNHDRIMIGIGCSEQKEDIGGGGVYQSIRFQHRTAENNSLPNGRHINMSIGVNRRL